MEEILKIFGIDPDTFSMKKGFAVATFTGLIFSIIGALSIENSYGLWVFSFILSYVFVWLLISIFNSDYNFDVKITKKDKPSD